MVLEVGIDGRGSRGSYSLGLINSRDGSPVRAVEPSDCRITAYREGIAEREISGLVSFVNFPHEINCANRIVRPSALPKQWPCHARPVCLTTWKKKEDGREAAQDGEFPCLLLPHHPPALMTKISFQPAAQGLRAKNECRDDVIIFGLFPSGNSCLFQSGSPGF
jgi:hypothetical protein